MPHKIVAARIPQGYSGHDHLIDSDDEARVRAMIGKSYPTFRAADQAAQDAFSAGCDRRVGCIPIKISTVNSRGEFCGPLKEEAAYDAQRRAESTWCSRCRSYVHPTDDANCPRGDSWDSYHAS